MNPCCLLAIEHSRLGSPRVLFRVAMITLSLWAWPGYGQEDLAKATPAALAPASKRTLILTAATRATYSLTHELEFLRLLLQRVDTAVDSVPMAEITPARCSNATHLVVFCPEPDPTFPPNLLQELRDAQRPVLWVGHGIGGPQIPCGSFGQVNGAPGPNASPSTNSGRAVSRVSYQGKEWNVGLAEWIPIPCRPSPAGAASAVPEARPIITLSAAPGADETPLCWQHGLSTVFSAVPKPGLLSFLFSDVLVDFFGITNAAPARLLLRIDDYQPGSDHYEFQTKVDLLTARGVPFLVSVTPSWRLSPTGAVMTLDSAPDYVESLRQAQARGGRLLMRGCVRGPTGEPEYWNGELDRPLALAPEQLREQLHQGVALMMKHGLWPVGWETPEDAASRAVYREVGQVFSMAVERPQLSDLTARETALLSAPVRDREGRQILPENVGFLPSAALSTNGLTALRTRAEFLTQLRGTIACVSFHAYLPQDQLIDLLGTLRSLGKPFLDVLARDQWVHAPGRLLLTGRAERRVQLAGGMVQWRAFDSAGQELQSEQETLPAGERVLQRKGRGAYELYEFKEGERP